MCFYFSFSIMNIWKSKFTSFLDGIISDSIFVFFNNIASHILAYC